MPIPAANGFWLLDESYCLGNFGEQLILRLHEAEFFAADARLLADDGSPWILGVGGKNGTSQLKATALVFILQFAECSKPLCVALKLQYVFLLAFSEAILFE